MSLEKMWEGPPPTVRCWKETDLRNWELCKLPRRARAAITQSSRGHMWPLGPSLVSSLLLDTALPKGFSKALGQVLTPILETATRKPQNPVFIIQVDWAEARNSPIPTPELEIHKFRVKFVVLDSNFS